MSLTDEALTWLRGQAVETGAGLEWPDGPTLYSGGAGIVLSLLEADPDTALRGARALADVDLDESGLYFGLSGVAVALRAVDRVLDDPASGAAADRMLGVVRARFDGEGWSDAYELLAGHAGIALAALALGDADLALTAVTPYVRTARSTAGGVQWENRTGVRAVMHHIAHGTLGVVLALATVGEATGRPDLLDLALAGAADVVSRNEAGPDGFLVPHSDPPHKPDRNPRWSYGWCHGPAGDAQVFRRLAAVTGDPVWTRLVERCWSTVVASGLPRRLRPGFWDNNGRCCGTAGVLALALDLDELDFAARLVADLDDHAIRDAGGARWSNVEHRATPSALAPHTGWAMGNAGILRELLRHDRLRAGGDTSYRIDWPDHPSV